MKTFKKIALKAAAVCMAVVTTLSMVLNPLPLNAFDYTAYFDRGIEGDNYFVNEWDMEEGDFYGGSKPKCGFTQKETNCGSQGSGGLYGWLSRQFGSVGAEATGNFRELKEKDCDYGIARTCEYRADCSGSTTSTIVACQPDCSIVRLK